MKNNSIKKYIKKHISTANYKRIGELINIIKKRRLYRTVKLDDSEKKDSKDFLRQNYGKAFPLYWHRLYKSYTGKFDKKYFPEILYTTKLELILNDEEKCKILEDKSLIELLFSKVENLHFPNTIIMCCNGVWYDNDRNIITYEKALSIIKNVGKCIFKKISETSSGRDVKLYNIKNGVDLVNNLPIEKILKMFNNNFIVQECLKNCKDISKIYDKSINTFRIITYTINGKIYHTPSVMRIGRNNNYVDNAHAGGIFIGINDEGQLNDCAYTEYQERFYEHPNTKVKFAEVKISKFPEVIKAAHRCQCFIPYARIVSWDFALNDKDEVVLIEANLLGQGSWVTQIANGQSLFGNNTEYMLELIKR